MEKKWCGFLNKKVIAEKPGFVCNDADRKIQDLFRMAHLLNG
jgi:hypothetical protein